jgi:hypothetical protein
MERYIAAVIIELERALYAERHYDDLRYGRERNGGRGDAARQVFDEFYAHRSDSVAWGPSPASVPASSHGRVKA